VSQICDFSIQENSSQKQILMKKFKKKKSEEKLKINFPFSFRLIFLPDKIHPKKFRTDSKHFIHPFFRKKSLAILFNTFLP